MTEGTFGDLENGRSVTDQEELGTMPWMKHRGYAKGKWWLAPNNPCRTQTREAWSAPEG